MHQGVSTHLLGDKENHPDVVFFEDKTHLEDYPSARVDEAPAVKVDISPK